ncbi:hypothetical protein BKA66DRAFT_478680 [Pyrenochaeta sp. MPI-SDFR-AT-0127]|nr:hypothetical protein BKA66DRAFT_478680 [Pyrenochaeta sp. MPI-SDFR-AT-0127]
MLNVAFTMISFSNFMLSGAIALPHIMSRTYEGLYRVCISYTSCAMHLQSPCCNGTYAFLISTMTSHFVHLL